MRLDGFEEGFRSGGQILVEECLTLGVEDAEIHRSGVEVDAAVGLMLLLVEPHRGLAFGVWYHLLSVRRSDCRLMRVGP